MSDYDTTLEEWEEAPEEDRFRDVMKPVTHDLRNIMMANVFGREPLYMVSRKCMEFFGKSAPRVPTRIASRVTQLKREMAYSHNLIEEGEDGYTTTRLGEEVGKPVAAHAVREAADSGIPMASVLGGRSRPDYYGGILLELYEDGERSLDELSDSVGRQKSVTGAQLSSLQEVGLVRGEDNPFSKSPRASLTDRGERFTRNLVEPIHRTAVDAEPAEELKDSLNRYRENPQIAREESAEVFRLWEEQTG